MAGAKIVHRKDNSWSVPLARVAPGCLLGFGLLLAVTRITVAETRPGPALGEYPAEAMPGQAVQGGAQDREAFRAARATADPAERLRALQQFLTTYPESGLRERATELALETALAHFPAETAEVHALAAQRIADAPPGLERTLEQARVADALAAAEPHGADSAGARVWAEAALAAMGEETYRRETAATQRRYKLPPRSAREVHRSFVHDRVLCLAALAQVDLREAKFAAAEPLLVEAYQLAPLSSGVNALRGDLAFARHQDGAALEAWERAEATGALPAAERIRALELYAARSGKGKSGGDASESRAITEAPTSSFTDTQAGFEAQVDALYARLMPAVYTLPPRTLPPGGHTALLELFTGAGCEPCVAPDLAVESLLTTYGRGDLAVLEYDENIPRPDPLTSPASASQALAYRVGATPEAFLDGISLPVAGSTRGDVENVVVGFASEIEDEAAQPSPVRLTLSATAGSAGVVAIHASVALAAGVASSPLPSRLVMHTALVQDGLRYSGENGVRFHRMVVRAMAPDTPLRFPAGPAGASVAGPSPGLPQTLETSFDLKAVASSLRSYLDAYEHGNDRYSEVHFRTKDLPLDPARLGVVVWVQDPSTRAVLQAAYAAVPEVR